MLSAPRNGALTLGRFLLAHAEMLKLKAEFLEYSSRPGERVLELEEARLCKKDPPRSKRTEAEMLRRIAKEILQSLPDDCNKVFPLIQGDMQEET